MHIHQLYFKEEFDNFTLNILLKKSLIELIFQELFLYQKKKIFLNFNFTLEIIYIIKEVLKLYVLQFVLQFLKAKQR